MTAEEWEAKCLEEGDMWPAPGEIAAIIRKAIYEEREACARIAEAAYKEDHGDVRGLIEVATAIRARSDGE